MKATDAVREIMKEKGISLGQMANTLDTSVRLVSDRLRMQNISLSKLRELLRVIDYKVVIVPRTTRIPDGGYEIE